MNPTDQSFSGIYCDQSLSRRLERAEGRNNLEFVEARAKVFPNTGSQWIEVAGAMAMFDGVDSPCTQTFGLGMFGEIKPADLAKLEQFFQQRGAPVYHEVSPLAEPSLLTLLNERGYQPLEFSTVLFRPIRPEVNRKSSVDSIEVRPISSDEHDLWARTAADGWADVAPGLEEFCLEVGRLNPHRPQTHCFLAEKQGEAIAAAAVFLDESVAVLAGASTVPKWRKQGAQSALLEKRLQLAAEQGCDLAMIVTQPGSHSQHNAERQGFRVAYTRIKWKLPQ